MKPYVNEYAKVHVIKNEIFGTLFDLFLTLKDTFLFCGGG